MTDHCPRCGATWGRVAHFGNYDAGQAPILQVLTLAGVMHCRPDDMAQPRGSHWHRYCGRCGNDAAEPVGRARPKAAA